MGELYGGWRNSVKRILWVVSVFVFAGFAGTAGAQDNTEDQVQAMYVAYYGRPGDAAGIDFWAERLQANGGSLDNETLVNNIYLQLLGRDADAGGLDFYLSRLDSGTLTLASIALDIYNGVQNADTDIVANKLAVANSYTDYVEESGATYDSDDITAAQVLLDTIDATDSSREEALTSLIALIDASADLTACEEKTAAFEDYSDLVSVSCDDQYFYIDTATSLPTPSSEEADKKMVGITAWIQRVPLPWKRTWSVTLEPGYLSGSYQAPSSLGPIAFAANGVPMLHLDKRPADESDPNDYDADFDTVLLGELDQCGAHSGNGEDYHYHYPPVCMLNRHDLSQPIAYGLDGVAVYYGTGGTDFYGQGRYNEVNNFPDGVSASDLDECNALMLDDGTYVHYTSTTAPYYIGCHRASVDASLNNQNPGNARSLDRAPWLLDPGVEGMTITNFYTDDDNWRHLVLTADDDSNQTGSSEVLYRETTDSGDGNCWDFEYRTQEGVSTSDTEVFCQN